VLKNEEGKMSVKVMVYRKGDMFPVMAEVASSPDENKHYGIISISAGMYGSPEFLYIKRVFNKPHKFEARI